MELAKPEMMCAVQRKKHCFYIFINACVELQLSCYLVNKTVFNRITTTVFLYAGGRPEVSLNNCGENKCNKINIGLRLKLPSKMKAVSFSL